MNSLKNNNNVYPETKSGHIDADRSKMCKCKGWHMLEDHVCLICKEKTSNHLEDNCPKMCTCKNWHIPEGHKCFVCKQVGFII